MDRSMDLDARPHRAFIAIAETGSFSRAAAMLHISQPALSAQIKEFERRLGFRLLDRTSRKVSLTIEGRLFLDRSRRLVRETEWANNAARDIRNNQLRVGTAHYTAEIAERNRIIDDFVAGQPDVPLRVMRRSAEQLRDDLDRGDIDIAITLQLVPPDDTPTRADAAPSWVVAERALTLQLPHGDELAHGAEAIPAAALRGRAIAMIDRSHGVAIAESVGKAIVDAGAQPRSLPEGDGKAVLRQSARLGIAAVDLGWFDPPCATTVRRAVEGWTVHTRLVAMANPGRRRAGTDRFIDRLRAVAPPS
ncbi:MAG: LysR family transcriptional regulator [Sphingomonas sp.]|uniref:LysR family transcriptional regulator n=2 Tax=Sphingomonadaceae TaxID=41297 RepID=A0A2A4IA50_9SPHN|nr:LysR family transcriptional regulator [Sphingomonas adhaesiva]PZU79847.1 MAG: LysR family transcriptional regulator [Sphingomonas sp.]